MDVNEAVAFAKENYEFHRGNPTAKVYPTSEALWTLAAEVERLHTWDGLMSLLDEHWPETLVPTKEDDPARDPGARIVALLRWVERLRAQVEFRDAKIDQLRRDIYELRDAAKAGGTDADSQDG